MDENVSAADLALYTSLIRLHFPEVQLRTVRPITYGWDTIVLDVNGELMSGFCSGLFSDRTPSFLPRPGTGGRWRGAYAGAVERALP